jgi:hypothetical protein
MVKRYVFKFFASVGPGGSWASLIEQMCTAIYAPAYDVGNEEDLESAIDRQIKELREEFVNEMFEIQEEFDANATSDDQDAKDEAYKLLIDFLRKYIDKFVRLEKNKFMRERVYYQRSGQIALYEQANANYNKAEKNVRDNIVKQALTVIKPDPMDWDQYKEELANAGDGEIDEDIENRISEFEARKYMEMWTRIKTGFASEKQRLSQLRATGGASRED